MCLLTNWLVHNFVSKNRWGWRVPGHSEPGVPFIGDVYVLRRKQSHCKQTLANITALLGCFCENSLISNSLSFLYPENNYKAIGSFQRKFVVLQIQTAVQMDSKIDNFQKTSVARSRGGVAQNCGKSQIWRNLRIFFQCVYCTVIEPEGTLETKWQVPPYINEIWFSQKTSNND